jgi:hypothetical protein
MNRALSLGMTAIGVGLLAGCGAASNGGSPTAAPTGASTPTATAVPTPTAAPTQSQTAAPTALDPCQMVTVSEASSLTGVSYGAGTEGTTSGGGKTCVYGADTLNVFTVLVAVASDAATAQADWAAEEAQVKSALDEAAKGYTFTFKVDDVSNISGADRAAVGTGSGNIAGQTLGVAGVYLLKGPDFVSYSDLVLGHAAPSTSALEGEANTVVGRMT